MHEKVVLGSATVGSRGQVVLPKEIRELCEIQAGDTLIAMSRAGMGGPSIVLFKASSLAGALEDMEATGRRMKDLMKTSKGGQVRKGRGGGK